MHSALSVSPCSLVRSVICQCGPPFYRSRLEPPCKSKTHGISRYSTLHGNRGGSRGGG